MASPRSRTRLSWPLIILCGVLGFVFYLSSNSDPPIPALPALNAGADPDPGMAESTPVPDFVLMPIGDYAETLARPIFADTRRPPEPEPEAPPAEPEAPPPPAKAPPIPGLTISGIVISSSERFALILDAGSRNLKRISIGDEVGGWRVARIEVTRIVLRYGDAHEVYELKDRAPAKKSTPAEKSERRQRPASTPSPPTARTRVKPAGSDN